MSEELLSFERRRILKAAASTFGLGLAGCHGGGLNSARLTSTKYTDRPAMMAIGDSLYQGVRSLTFGPGMATGSPPAQVAAALNLPFTIPDPPRAIMFNLENIYRSPFPLITVPIDLPRQLLENSWAWRLNTNWSNNEAFDNVAIGGATIDSLYTDHLSFRSIFSPTTS